MSISLGDTRFDPSNIATDPEDLVALCESLVLIDRSSSPPLVSLTHYSVEEYLRSNEIKHSPMAFFHVYFHDSHLQLAQICLRYLSFDDFAGSAAEVVSKPTVNVAQLIDQYALLRYAAQYWASHLKMGFITAEKFNLQVPPMLQWFCKADVDGRQYSTWHRVFHTYCNISSCCHDISPLYNAIVLGLEGVLDMLLQATRRRSM